ncbi:MAG: glycoside hydrolase family 2 TIM barrel-domain containing protein [Clostridiaceae bacterium]
MKNNILKDLFIVPDIDHSRALISFTVPDGCSNVKWKVESDNELVCSGDTALEPKCACSLAAKFDKVILWNIHSPHLYTLKLILTINGDEFTAEEDFGMRKIHVSGKDIYVNNEKFYVRGYIRGREAHDHPNLENLPLVKYYEKNIRAAKDYGFNFIRFHSRIPPEECFEAADRLGIFIHVEIRKYYGKYQKERTMMNDAGELINEKDWVDAILSLRNHPSLMVYCMGNEIRHPGTNPQVEHIAKVTRETDPTRLFIDTCAHGEFDRTYVDIDVQHMSYFYPFGANYNMFENTYNWLIFGSCKGTQMYENDGDGYDFNYKVTRAIAPKRPILAHEICHYTALRDIDKLDEKFTSLHIEKPWWIDEVKKLIKLKRLEKDYPMMLEASRRFQFLSWKLGIEAARRSRLLSGFHFLQLSDTERYENSNGIIDCFDDKTGIDEKEFLAFNNDSAILADLPRRTYFENEKVKIPVYLSHFSNEIPGNLDFAFELRSTKRNSIVLAGGLKGIDLSEKGLREIVNIEIKLPLTDVSEELLLECKLVNENMEAVISNHWKIWVFPDRAEAIPETRCTVQLDDIKLDLRYPQLKSEGSPDKPEKLLIVNRFSKEVLKHMENGGDVLMLYRIPETRDRKVRANKEGYYLPGTWDRMKGIIWDRGTNHGGFVRSNKALGSFPNDGFIDLQFHDLIDDCDKIVLDDFPCDMDPIIQGVDKACRDRFDVYTFGLSELQPGWTMRKFGYLFELRVGKGRLLISGFNFTGLNSNKPEVCAMFESLLKYAVSDDFKPKASIEAGKLEKYLLEKGKQPRIKERKMTQYWQLNDAPLESDRYWKEAEEYIRETE